MRNITLLLATILLLGLLPAKAQDETAMTLEYTSRVKQLDLWQNEAPNSNGITAPETDLGLHVANVTKPVLTVYVPKHPNGLAVIACPGGSYIHVWQGTEGHNMANWYNSHGVTYAVLKYRLPNGHCDVPVSDVFRAMKIMKARSSLSSGSAYKVARQEDIWQPLPPHTTPVKQSGPTFRYSSTPSFRSTRRSHTKTAATTSSARMRLNSRSDSTATSYK